MSTRPTFLKASLVLAAIALLAGLTGCRPEGFTYDPQTGRLVTVTPPISPLQTPPSPAATPGPSQPQTRMPRPTPGPALPSDVTPPVFPTWTPFPTFPPPPTPTRRPGPTATPLPLPQPAKDAAGSIIYIARNEDKKLESYSISVDAAGLAQSAPVHLPDISVELSADIRVPQGLVPAPDGSRVAIVNNVEAGDIVSILYPDTGKVESLFKENFGGGIGNFLNWHPDSRHVLYRVDTNYSGNYPGLWLVDVDSGEIVTLVNQYPSPTVDGAVVSPDGQKVVYSVQKDTFSPGELWLINADGSDPRLLFTSGVAISAIAWSPDGSKIAFLGDGLMVIDAGGSNPRTLTHNFGGGYLFRPVWSPDSRTIAFVSVDGSNPLFEKGASIGGTSIEDWYADAFKGANIHLVNVVTGKERPLLADGSAGNIDPAWSPDGSQIVFASTRSGTSQIWVISADGTNLRQLTNADQLGRFPYWRKP